MKKRIIALLCFHTVLLLSLAAQDNPPFTRMDVFDLEWVSDPAISPDGQWIVYERNSMDIMKDRRTSELWIINSDGSQHQKLTRRDSKESNPTWSPDGKRIAFTGSTSEGTEIFVHHLENDKTTKLTRLDRSPSNLSWSPKGNQIAFCKLVPESEPKLVTPPSKPEGAKWAAAPRVITRLKHESDGSGYTEPGFKHIFIVPVVGGTPRQITDGNYQHRSKPIWTNDGQSLLFSANRNDDAAYDFKNSEIYKIDIATGKTMALTNRKGPDQSPALSPDGKTIAYISYEDRIQTYQISQIHLMDINGGNKRRLPLTLDRSVSNPTWANDGQSLYFQYDDHGNTKIAQTDLQGKHQILAHHVGGTAVARPYGGGSFTVSNKGDLAYNETTPAYPAELAFRPLLPIKDNYSRSSMTTSSPTAP